MARAQQQDITLQELIADLPKNWGRWGDDDEIGCLNYQTPDEVLRGVRQVRSGEPDTGIALPLHAALMRNLGALFSEILWFEELAADCREDGQWSFLYAAAPVHVVGATGAPVNPVVVK